MDIGKAIPASIGIVGITGLGLYGLGTLSEYIIRRKIRKQGYQTSFDYDESGDIYFPRGIFFPENL
jgi:hypothetical protein